jgi:hypothetical protein
MRLTGFRLRYPQGVGTRGNTPTNLVSPKPYFTVPQLRQWDEPGLRVHYSIPLIMALTVIIQRRMFLSYENGRLYSRIEKIYYGMPCAWVACVGRLNS